MVMVYWSAAAGQLSFPLELWMAATGWKIFGFFCQKGQLEYYDGVVGG